MKEFLKSVAFKAIAAVALFLVGIMIYAASTGGVSTIPAAVTRRNHHPSAVSSHRRFRRLQQLYRNLYRFQRSAGGKRTASERNQ